MENLFSEQDINQYNLRASDGFARTKELSSVIKNDIIYKKNALTNEIKDNFKKLFDALEVEVN